MDSILIENQSKLCRLCLRIVEFDDDLISIFSHCHDAVLKQRISFADILKTISTLNVIPIDELPKKICRLCVQQVRSSFAFKTHIEKSHATLARTFKKSEFAHSFANSPGNVSQVTTRRQSSVVQKDIQNDIIEVLSISTSKQSSPTRKLKTRSEKDIFKLPQTSRNSMEEMYNHKLNGRKIGDAKVVLEPYDSLETFPCSTCNRIFLEQVAFLKHDFKCVHNCPECKIDFQSELNFKAHFMKKHQVNLLVESVDEEAQIGEVVSYTKDDFVKKFIRNRTEHLRCTICLMNFDKSTLTIHLYTRHLANRPLKCSFCDDRFYVTSGRSNHMAKRHAQEYRCNMCETQFVKHIHLENHCLSLHNISTSVAKSDFEEEDPKTDIYLFIEKKSAEQKIRNRLNSEISQKQKPSRKITSFFTPQKDASCDSDYETMTHKQIKTEVDDDRTLEIAEFLETNIVTDETRLKPVVIQNDEDTASISNYYDENDDLEEIETTYTYDEFSEKFVIQLGEMHMRCIPCNNEILKSSFKLHIRNSHAKKPSYNCELCPKSFMKYEQRRLHMRDVHTNNFRCELCEKQFFHSMTFKEHMLFTHSEAVDIKTLKTADELDIPMERIQFIENPKRMEPRHKRGATGQAIKRKRNNAAEIEEFTFERFKKNFILTLKNGHTRCTICSVRIFQKTLKPHLLENHAITEFTFCEICDEGFNSDMKRKTHMEEAHPGQQKCVLCETQFTKESSYLQHMRVVHALNLEESGRSKMETIPFEKVLFSDEHPNLKKLPSYEFYEFVPDDIEMTKDQIFAKFLRTKKDDPSRAHCIACGISFRDGSRRAHIDVNHTTTKAYSCDICRMRFTVKFKLKVHMSIRHPEDYKCSTCNIQFTKCQQYVDHMKDEHGEILNITIPKDHDVSFDDLKYVRILEKNKTSELKTNFENSTEAEDVEEKVNCQYCNQEFVSQRMHRNHLRLDCTLNPNITIQSADMDISKLEPDSNELIEPQELPCEFCDKICTSKKMLMGHTNWHKRIMNISEKPKEPSYDCDICDEILPKQSFIYKHLKTCHQNEYHCGQCGSHGGSYIRAKAHLMTQHPRKVKLEMSKRHKCPQCFRSFNMIDTLNDHIRHKHENECMAKKSNYCVACGVIYPNEKMFEEHQENHYHKKYQKLFDAERERDLTGEPETFEEEQDSDDDKEDTVAFEPSFISSKRKRGYSTNSWASTSSSSMTSIVENSTKFDKFSQPIKKEKLELDTAVETSEQLDNDDSMIDETAYLNFMRSYDGVFKCSICEITKTERKLILQHLKEHDEVPKYSCDQCSESFLFKVGFETHLRNHQKDQNSNQENSVSCTNRCEICCIDFKLAIMLNRHNALSHP